MHRLMGVASLKFKVRTCGTDLMYAKKGTYYTNSVDSDETQRLIRVCAVCQDKHILGNGRLLKLYMIKLSFALR